MMQRRKDDYLEHSPEKGSPAERLSNEEDKPASGWKLVRASSGSDSHPSAARPDVLGVPGWLGVAVTAVLLAGVTWYLVRPIYEISGEIHCASDVPDQPVEYRALLSALKSPPRFAAADASSWTFGEVLSLGTVRFAVDPVRSSVRVTVETANPRRGRELCERWASERISVIGKDSEADRVAAVIDSLDVERDAGEGNADQYRTAVGELRELNGQLRRQRTIRREALSEVNDLRRQPPPRGVVREEKLLKATLSDLALQQDLQHLRARVAEIRTAYMGRLSAALESFSQLSPASNALEVQLRELQERELNGPAAEIVFPLRRFADTFGDQGETLQGALVGSLAALREASPDDTVTLLGIVDRMDAVARKWKRTIEDGLGQIDEMVEALSEGRASSVRQVLIQNQVKRLVFSLKTGTAEVSKRLGKLSREENFQLDAHAKIARGLLLRTTMRTRKIAESLQAEADEEARRARQAELAMLEQELGAVRHIEQEMMGRFLAVFDRMLSLEDAALDEVIAEEQWEFIRELRSQMGRIYQDPLDGIILTAGPFTVDPQPRNQSDRILLSSAIGAGGGVASLLVLLVVGLSRRWASRPRM